MKNVSYGLVLEGGGLRGVFTAGVLDCFIDHNINFPYIVGVSAGACNASSFHSKQRGRSRFCDIDLMKEQPFVGIRTLIRKRTIIDMDLLFDEFPNQIYPFDYEAYFNNPNRLEMVTTNCLTGRANYLEETRDKNRLISICRASSSLPYGCPIVTIDKTPMLDGGIADAIPFDRAFSQGFKKCIVVLTRNKGYRKPHIESKFPSSLFYPEYPHLCETLKYRNIEYNKKMQRLEQLEREGTVLIIRPEKPVKVDRIETNTKKMEEFYQEGYKICKRHIEEKFLKELLTSQSNSNYPFISVRK